MRTLEYESRGLPKIQRSLSSQYAGPMVEAVLGKLVARGYLLRKWGLYSLTKKGRAALPSSAPDLSKLHGTYVPPKVYRRNWREACAEPVRRRENMGGGFETE